MEDVDALGFIVLVVANFTMSILYFVHLYRFAAELKRDHPQLWEGSRKNRLWPRESDSAIAVRILQFQDLSKLSAETLRRGSITKRFLYAGVTCFSVLLAVVLWMSVTK
jgi:hypothetical protein